MGKPVKIDVYSHHFVVHPSTSEHVDVLSSFSRKYMRWGVRKVRRQFVKTPVAVFATYPRSRKWLRGHIKQLKTMIDLFYDAGFKDEEILITSHDPENLVWSPIDLKIQPGWAPRGEQQRVLDFLDVDDTRTKLVTLQTGGGKAQPLDALVLTPTGYTTMGEIEVGTKVLSKHGVVTEVTEIYPQGEQDIYQLEFHSGLKVECTLDHLWLIKIMDTADKRTAKEYTVTTRELIDKIHDPKIGIYVPFYDEETKHTRSGILLKNIKMSRRAEAQCIKVADPSHLYITNGGIVTHNSYIMMQNVANRNVPFLLIVRPMYIEKWVLDLKKTFVIKDEEIVAIAGGDNLRALLNLYSQGGSPFKAIIISNKTIQNWYKDYEQFEDEILSVGWACRPQDLCNLLNSSVLNIDEAHIDFHLNFKVSLYTHCIQKVDSSATMLPDDPFIKKMTDLVYSHETKYKPLSFNKYIATYCIHYEFNDPNKVRYIEADQYSHSLLEKSIRRIPDVRNRYYEMICHFLENEFLGGPGYKPGFKCLVFCYSIDMCTELRDFVARRFPDKIVNKYTQGDDYDLLINMDICISTVLKAGTAVDVDGLYTVLMTTAISSSQSNTQALGRLRVMKDGTTPRFFWFCCDNIQKHKEYSEKKKGLYQDKSISFNDVFYNDYI